MVSVVEAGGLEALERRLNSGDPITIRSTIVLLGLLSKGGQYVRAAVLSSGLLRALVQLLPSTRGFAPIHLYWERKVSFNAEIEYVTNIVRGAKAIVSMWDGDTAEITDMRGRAISSAGLMQALAPYLLSGIVEVCNEVSELVSSIVS